MSNPEKPETVADFYGDTKIADMLVWGYTLDELYFATRCWEANGRPTFKEGEN